ncbi:FecR family protein [Pedobacter frigoris]|uniref:FecR family protein n=1 Tax=Pedobacter frigoris TaxID=2571272 RepID=A0A4U1CC96_9SPHI|nr:FecR family protein [Pedobacter frigoris]TKC03675.1 FecR family protein [Pedobacter frigoris]
MQEVEVKYLLKKYESGECTEAEKALVESWYLKYRATTVKTLSEAETESDILEIWSALEKSAGGSKRIILWSKLAVAALIVFTLSAMLYFTFNGGKPQKSKDNLNSLSKAKQIIPGTDKAILILADGTKIDLDDKANGQIANQSGIKIEKTADGHLHYTVTETDKTKKAGISYNTIETPKGGKYQITLPDGSEVWLDAASSLRYPTKFVAKERKVELSGQAYFEIAKDKTKPFKVITDKQQIEVFGTHFNVNAYSDEKEVLTTLLEGSVKVGLLNNDKGNFIKPGEQAVLKENKFQVKAVDVETVVAWKNGDFVFENEEAGILLNKLARWYDVQFVCDEKLRDIKLGGKISRSKNLYDVLRILQLTRKINFEVQGRRIIAMP